VNAPINDSLRIRLGAAILALATLAAIVFGIINFQQRTIFSAPDDGASWWDTSSGVLAWHVMPNSPAANAGIRTGDHVLAIDGAEIHGAIDVTKRLWRTGLWSQAHYRIDRGGRQFETQLVTQPAEKPSSIENYLPLLACSTSSSACSSSRAAGTPRAPCTFTFFAWFPSSFTPSNSRAS